MSNLTSNPFKLWLDTLEVDAWYTVTTTLLLQLRNLVNEALPSTLSTDDETFKVIEYLAENKVLTLVRNDDKSLKIKKIT